MYVGRHVRMYVCMCVYVCMFLKRGVGGLLIGSLQALKAIRRRHPQHARERQRG